MGGEMSGVAVIFGGSGFIGVWFADMLIREQGYTKVYLADLERVDDKPHPFRVRLAGVHGSALQFVSVDVRNSIEWRPLESVSLVANFAAVHREPGHEDSEYFETNIHGARNVCAWADRVGCDSIVFTSSISPYGISEAEKTEETLTVPVTAYGSSKLIAEEIHRTWQALAPAARRLTIVRPGVVFGPGEGGNVSRLVKAVSRGYFLYMGNRNTRKAGIYVKELCNSILWVRRRQLDHGIGVELFNASMNPGPSISDYVESVKRVGRVKAIVPNMPYGLLLAASYLIELVARPLRISHPFSPVRIRKLVRSNNVLPGYLESSGYQYRYDLDSAFADWKSECPSEWA
ncbi:NAD-dependent epimerase/dehydratase [Stenotrophomonas sp. SPM]|nr:NAD-dependent epimerase/dehydratase [Stenotrophomonas sp. SPM]